MPEKPEEMGKMSFLGTPFHIGEITAVTVCIKKPLVFTAGKDKTIRKWTYSVPASSLTLEYY